MSDDISLNRALAKNHVQLQKVSLDLIESVSHLSKKIDKMLSLFEEAAKNIQQGEVDGSLERKLEALLEQNKVIARGLVLIEKYIRDKTVTGFRPSSLEEAEL